MRFPHRIRTIYRKELIDILRDRRTLIAMIVVPIVLYPLLMLGSIQAVSYQAEALADEPIVVGFLNKTQQESFARLVQADVAALEMEQQEPERHRKEAPNEREKARRPRTEEPEASAAPLADLRAVHVPDVEALQRAVRNREIHIGLTFAGDHLINDERVQNRITVHADFEDVRSRTAAERVQGMIERITRRTQQERLARIGKSEVFIRPFQMERADLSAPSSILGQILPLILVLMTITGAIYPAIDLTAGERERGTLETLIACPVPVIDLIVGKFLVVTTVAILGAALNLACVSITVYFVGLGGVLAGSAGAVPVGKMLFILASLVPFAVLMSAIMLAVCSYARTFKEAQNYVTPIILAVLIPGGIAAMPATRLEGVLLVLPVANMVLLAREVLMDVAIPFWKTSLVLTSTTLYAATAVAIAANLFGKESVLFPDATSLRSMFSRAVIKPATHPSVSGVLLGVALLFPVWFFVQASLSGSGASGPEEASALPLIRGTAVWMPLLFVLVPLAGLAYWKVDVRATFALRPPAPRFVVAAILVGAVAWVPVFELNVLQQAVLPIPRAALESLKRLQEAVAALSPWEALLALALIPAVCEELLFRGFLLSGVGAAATRWTAILAAAVVFGVFHFAAFKFLPTAVLGLVLGYLCWQSRSIYPGMIVHALHNGLAVAAIHWPWQEALGIKDGPGGPMHLPLNVLLGGAAIFLVGILLIPRGEPKAQSPPVPALAG